jgi:cyclase
MSTIRRTGTVILILFYLTTAGISPAQQQPLTVQKIKGGIYMVKGGSGANTGFYVGDKEVLVIDSKMTADSEKQVFEEIKKVTANPITRIIITHSDGDHVNGLNAFPSGLKIYGHPQAAKDMEEASKAPGTPYLRDYLPTEVCTPCAPSKQSMMVVRVGDEAIQLYYFGPAHTSGDYVVYFAPEKVAFIGDLAFLGRDPLIHRQKGGTSAGYIDTLQALLSLDADTFISGHNDPLTRQDIQGLAKSMSEKRDKVKALISEGKSLDEIKKTFGVVDAPAQAGRQRFLSLVEVIYLDLTEKK